MIGVLRAARAAIRGVRAELSAGDGGWVAVSGRQSAMSLTGRRSKSGQMVSPESAMSLSAVWACVTRTSQLIASLPVALYEKKPDGSRVRVEDDLAEILTLTPNRGQTGLEFWEGTASQALMQGNAYAEKQFIGRRLVGLQPLFGVTPKRNDDGSFRYEFSDRGKRHVLPGDKVFHLRGFGSGDGMGLSAVRYGVQSLGSALSADEAASTIFANGMALGGTVESEHTLTPEQRALLQANLDAYRGSANFGKIMTLEAGLKFSALSMNPEDAQLLETRRFQVEDICRWFGVPPIVIGHAAEGQTMWGTGVEAIMLAWLTTGINPFLRRIEARIARDLIPEGKRGKWYLEWNREAMLQMDSGAKAEFLSRMVTSGIMTSDESREKLNLARRGGAADTLRAQTALAPLEELMRGANK